MMIETLWYRDQETGERLYGAAISDRNTTTISPR